MRLPQINSYFERRTISKYMYNFQRRKVSSPSKMHCFFILQSFGPSLRAISERAMQPDAIVGEVLAALGKYPDGIFALTQFDMDLTVLSIILTLHTHSS